MKTNHILLTAALLLCGASCTKENIDIPDTVDDNTLYPVTFSGGIDLVQTKTQEVATSTMREGIKTKIFVYKSDESNFKTDTLASKEYTVGADGKLVIDPSDTIYLAKGSYKIRAFAIDTLPSISFPDFDFSNGNFLASNDSSYLYAGADATIDGTAKAQNVDLTFKRKAVKIVINIASTSGIVLDSWADSDSAKILPPYPGSTCKMTLSDGTITPATSVYTNADDAKKMACTAVADGKTTVSYIMLPLVDQSGSPVPTVTLKVKVKNATETNGVERTYTTALTYPTGGFESGKQYTYTATLKANGITFNAATVEDWTEGISEGSGDLTPTEPADNGSSGS